MYEQDDDGERSGYRPMTIDEIFEEERELQQKLYEQVAKDLPGEIETALAQMESDSSCDEILANEGSRSIDGGARHPVTNGFPNGHALKKHMNGSYSNVNDIETMEMMRSVREREVENLTSQIDQMRLEHRREIHQLQAALSRTSDEKQRGALSLKETQDRLQAAENQIIGLQAERDQLEEVKERLSQQLNLEKLTVEGKEKMIQILENSSQENRIAMQLEKQIKMKDAKHEAEINNLNDQLELSFKKCKSLERALFDLENKVKYLDTRNDDMMTQKAETVTRLMMEIQSLQDLTHQGASDPSARLQRSLLEKQTVEKSLRAQLAEKEGSELALRNQLEHFISKLEGRQMEMDELRSENDTMRARLEEPSLAGKLPHAVPDRIEAAVGTESWTMDHYNAQYLKFHEEQMADLDARRRADLEVKDAIIEGLRVENEEVKRLYLAREGASPKVDVHKLQEQLATATERLHELRRTHSEHCQLELDKREKQIYTMKHEAEELNRKLILTKDNEKDLNNKIYTALKDNQQKEKTIENLKTEVERLQIECVDCQKVVAERCADIARLEQEMATLINDHREELDILRSKQISPKPERSRDVSPRREDKAVSPINGCRGGEVSVGTSPVAKTLTEVEVMRLLHTLATRHEEERMHLEGRIERLMAGPSSQNQMVDAMTCTDPLVEPSTELTLVLWRRLEEMRALNEQLTARTQQTEGTQMEASSLQAQLERVRAKALKLKNELTAATEKYNKLRGQAKHYKDFFTKIISEIKEDWERERRDWKKERELLKKVQEACEAERVMREAALLEVQADVRCLKQSRGSAAVDPGVDAVAKLYDELVAVLKGERTAGGGGG